MIAAETVVTLYDDLVKERGADFARMRQFADVNDSDIVIPLPELGQVQKPLVANLAKNGLDQMSQRAASVLPAMQFPPRNRTKAAGDKAKLQTTVGHWFWQENEMPLVLRQRARYLWGYAASPVRIGFDATRETPTWETPTPLGVVAPMPASPLTMEPPFAIASRRYSVATLRRDWGAHGPAMAQLSKARPGDEWEVLEYADDHDIALVLAGKVDSHQMIGQSSQRVAVMLTAVPNRTGKCPWVFPGLFHLRKPQGHFDGMLGMYQAAAHLSALGTYAAFKGVMQETWLVARQGETPDVIAEANAMTGEIGIVQGGALQNIAPDPQWQTNTQLDRLMEQQRMDAGIPSDFQGMAATNVRTGRRASQIISATTDFALQEVQEIFAASLEREMCLATSFDHAYLRKGKTISLHLRGEFSEYNYKSTTLWDGYGKDKARVSYEMSGMDANAIAIRSLQLVGAGAMSRRRMMELTPEIADVDAEEAKIMAERLEDAQAESILAQASTPDGPYGPEQMATLVRKVRREGKPLWEAVLELAEEERERQAAAVEAGSPESQPGLVPLEAEPPPIIDGPSASTENLASLMSRLRQPSMTVSTPGGGRA